MSYSQNDEEKYILAYFGDRDGICLDIGAYNGKTMSNTHQLILNGWRGVLIEPSPKPFIDCLELYRGNENVILVNAAIQPEGGNGLVKFYDSNGDAVNTMNEAHRQLWSKDVKYQPYYTTAVTIDEIYEEVGIRVYNFINLDVEGMNYAILKTLDLSMTELVCVEFENQYANCISYLSGLGFHLIHSNSENIIMGR